ncbi:MAG: hypothetical protein FWE98_02710 [Oscillospiraceae bacterium]|nr:hypothetical protein [Oscillospiraceae bacterium]
MSEPAKITKTQLFTLARQLKTAQGTAQEAQALESLAQTGLNEGQQAQLRELMRDKAKLAQMMSSPKAQALMRKLKTGNGEQD